MTANRRAELQRKLAMAPVPKPPAGLADRIKSDIPGELMVDADKERRRLRQAVSFNIRVAASIILLVSSVYLALNLLSRRFGPMEMAAKSDNAAIEHDTATAAAPSYPVTAMAREMPPAPPTLPASAKVDAPKLEKRNAVIVAQARPEPLALRDAETAAESGNASTKEESVTARDRLAAPAAAPMIQSDSMPARQVLDVEIAAAPFDATKYIVRVPLDAQINFDDDAVAAGRPVAPGLYEIIMRPGLRDVIAVVHDGDRTRTIRRSELRTWNDASPRTKAAALEAALAAGVDPELVAAKAKAAGLEGFAAH